MKLLTKQDILNMVADRWRSQYCSNNGWKYQGKDSVYDKLEALGDNPKSTDIDRVIGNNSWTSLTCQTCNREVDAVVIVGDGECEIYTCKKCVKKMHKLFKTLGD